MPPSLLDTVELLPQQPIRLPVTAFAVASAVRDLVRAGEGIQPTAYGVAAAGGPLWELGAFAAVPNFCQTKWPSLGRCPPFVTAVLRRLRRPLPVPPVGLVITCECQLDLSHLAYWEGVVLNNAHFVAAGSHGSYRCVCVYYESQAGDFFVGCTPVQRSSHGLDASRYLDFPGRAHLFQPWQGEEAESAVPYFERVKFFTQQQ